MYSILMALAMTTPADCPQAVASAGCAGTMRTPVRTLWAALPHPLLNGLHKLRSTGCAGSAAATSCGGSASFTTSSRTVTRTVASATVKMPVPPVETATFGGRIEKAAVHRQLRVALRSENVPADQRAAMHKAVNDPDVYEAAVAKVHRDLSAKAATGGPVGKIGDGALLKLIIDNLPAIIAAILQILAAFGV